MGEVKRCLVFLSTLLLFGSILIFFVDFGPSRDIGIGTLQSHSGDITTTATLTSEKWTMPEPAKMFLVGSGLIGVGVFVRKKFKK
jgi:hypothetical protein